MKILVTGKNGQVGQELLRSLNGLGEVIALDRSQLDLADLDAVRATVRAVAPDLIINAAAYTAVDQAETEIALAMRINGDAPGVLAEEANKIGAALIHYSTDYIFDGSKAGAWTEDDVPAPLSVYGRSKLAGEQAIAATGVPHLILRTSWVYGLHGKNFLLTMLRLAQTRPELSIVNDQFGAPTWSRTIAEATAQIVRQSASIDENISEHTSGHTSGRISEHISEHIHAHSGLYHMSAGGRTSWHGFAQKIFDHPSIQDKPLLHAIPTADYPLPAKRPQNSELNTTKFQHTFCSLPQWDEALAYCLQELTTAASSHLKAR